MKFEILVVTLCNVLLAGETDSQCAECDRSDFCDESEFAPDPSNCGQYFACRYGAWEPLSCPADYAVFDTQTCKCDVTGTCLECPSTTPSGSTIPSEPCSEIPIPCEEGRRYPDQADCYAYYTCTNGELGTKTQCQIGEEYGSCYIESAPCVFDIDTSECVQPDGSFDCDRRCYYYTAEPGPPGCDADPCDKGLVCLDGELTADASNCSDYFVCSFNRWKKLSCAPGFRFDNETCSCRLENNAVCHECVYPPTTTPEYTGQCMADPCFLPDYCSEQEITADKDDCNSYYICNFGDWVNLPCPDNGFFDVDSCSCISENATCLECPPEETTTPVYGARCQTDPCSLPSTCDDGEITPDPGRCDYYYICNFGIWETLQCPNNYLFDSQLCSCEDPANDQCYECVKEQQVVNGNSKSESSTHKSSSMVVTFSMLAILAIGVMISGFVYLKKPQRKVERSTSTIFSSENCSFQADVIDLQYPAQGRY